MQKSCIFKIKSATTRANRFKFQNPEMLLISNETNFYMNCLLLESDMIFILGFSKISLFSTMKKNILLSSTQTCVKHILYALRAKLDEIPIDIARI